MLKRWTEKEIEILFENAGRKKIEYIQKNYIPYRTCKSIYNKMYYLGISDTKTLSGYYTPKNILVKEDSIL